MITHSKRCTFSFYLLLSLGSKARKITTFRILGKRGNIWKFHHPISIVKISDIFFIQWTSHLNRYSAWRGSYSLVKTFSEQFISTYSKRYPNPPKKLFEDEVYLDSLSWWWPPAEQTTSMVAELFWCKLASIQFEQFNAWPKWGQQSYENISISKTFHIFSSFPFLLHFLHFPSYFPHFSSLTASNDVH